MSNGNLEPQDIAEPPRLKFYEEVQLTFQKTVDALCRNVPEFRGAVVSLVWDMDSSRDLPHGLILGKQVQSPQFTLRAAEQVNKTLINLLNNFQNQLINGDEAARELDQRIAAARQELHGIEQKITQKANAAGIADEHSGVAAPSEH